nr:MAG TPA: hypothetical protein [Caudoviricetes sp.]
MTVKEAIVIFAKQFPDKAVVGYWDKPNGIVLNTQSTQSCPLTIPVGASTPSIPSPSTVWPVI